MDSGDVTALTGAFAPSEFLGTLVAFGPYIISGLVILIGVSLLWGVVRRVRHGVGHVKA